MPNNNWILRDATIEDYQITHAEPLENSVRAWALEVNGELCGLGGVVLVKGAYTIFIKLRADMRVSKAILVKALKEGWKRISQMKFVNLYAIKEEGSKTAENLFRKFGFEDKEDSEHGRVYIWRAQK